VNAGHMPALDGFRAVAAFSVITLHGGYGAWFDGVTAFFVLSGFLITTLLIREMESTGAVSLRAFYARRTLRIFPAYYACVVASFTIDHVAGNRWPNGLTPSAFAYVVNYFNSFNGHPSTSIAHLWSLGVEEQFYLLWPILLFALARRGRHALQITLTGIIVGGVGWRLVLHYGVGIGQAYLYNAFDARFDNLAIGCMLATLVGNAKVAGLATALGRYAWSPLVTFALLFVVIRALPALPLHLFGFTLYSVLVGILIVQLLELHGTVMWRWLDAPVARFLGTISYPIYLYHVWGLGLGHWMTGVPHAGQVFAGTLFTIAAAAGSYYIVERPFLELKHRFGPGRRRSKVRAGEALVVPT
jgi:peptidoglycan/LPS O-acetylase OafA/YrhL